MRRVVAGIVVLVAGEHQHRRDTVGDEFSFDKGQVAVGVGFFGDVGPPLNGLGKDKTREYLLESIVDPNKQIAKGFETVELTLASGQIRSGGVKNLTDFVCVSTGGPCTYTGNDMSKASCLPVGCWDR